MDAPPRLLFAESQRLTLWWAWLLVMAAAALAWWSWLSSEALAATNLMPGLSRALLGVLYVVSGILLPLFLVLLRLETRFTERELIVRWWPVWGRRIPLDRIGRHGAVRYRPFRDYGGFGLRFSPRFGWAWNASGNRGVKLQVAGGRPVLVGSQRPDDLEAVLVGARFEAAPTSQAAVPPAMS